MYFMEADDKNNKPLISLILATIDRPNECKIFLNSLKKQTYDNFELIIVDQNKENVMDDIIKEFENNFLIKHIRVKIKGLSKARNVGLKKASGDIICFPDDDCEYESTTLDAVASCFSQKKADAITGKYIKEKNFVKDNKKTSEVNIYNVWKKGISFTIFIKRHMCMKIGCFDENIGVGSETKYGSGEETDYLIRILKAGGVIYNTNAIQVSHPKPVYDNYNKAYSYSMGRMYVLRKHSYPRWFILANIVYPLIKMLWNFNSKIKIKYLWYQFLGRMKG